MATFHKLKVIEVIHETKDAISIAFEVPETLREELHYIQGQYLTIKVNVNGSEFRRSYSVCSSPFVDEPLKVAVKRVAGGKVSNYLNDNLKSGDVVEVMTPMGNFHTPLDPSNTKHYILFGGGSGITPMKSIIKSVLVKEPLSKVTLFYGNRDIESIIFKESLESLASKSNGRFSIVHILDNPPASWEGYTGIMNKEKVLQLLREKTDLNFYNAEVFICGPAPMMSEVKSAVEALMIPDEKLHIEYFTAKDPSEAVSETVGSSSNGAAGKLESDSKTKVKLMFDGGEFDVEMTPKQTILEAALDAGLDPPYSCMVAACCTCRAKLLSGQVDMEDREALTDEEIDEGFVLTCQSHPTTHGIILDYDA
ncbi:MAG: 2Fe-2S iron-sulfur cluster binding domain-containing protein [Chitinophagales bacterium]|nr:2Fe-2S iron-sulfur cluster binding domain-containing protein [Chitinophagales bacterium]